MADCGAAPNRPAAVLRRGRRSAPAKGSSPTSAENFHWNKSRPSLTSRSAIFHAHFAVSTGLPPHQWLLRQRVKAAKQLMTVRDLPLSEIAMSAGFANQSHFTRVFSAAVGVSPGAWRREMHGAPESET